MNTRQIKARFQKRHIEKLVKEVLSETSEFSKREGSLRYILKAPSIQYIAEGISIASIEETSDSIKVFTQVLRRGEWVSAYKFTIFNDRILAPWGFAKLEIDTIDRTIKYCISMDHFMCDSTAISVC